MKYLIIIIISLLLPTITSAKEEDIFSLMDSNEELKTYDNVCPFELFQNPEQEYKDYISACSTEMQVCLNKCLKGSPNHCSGLANNLHSDTVDSKYTERLYAKACKHGLVTACTNRAAGLLRFNPERKECYSKTFKLTCSKSDAWGCTMYGLVLSRGIGLKKDSKLALKVLKTGCKHGIDDEACKYAKKIEKGIINQD